MNIESKIGDSGLYITNCIDKGYLDQLNIVLSGLQKEDATQHFYRTSIVNTEDSSLIKHLREKIREGVLKYLEMKNLDPLDFVIYNEYPVYFWKLNKSLDPHIDTIKTENSQDPRPVVNVLLYISDGYTGGEVRFPEEGVVIKPEIGSLLVYDAGLEHAVNAVTHGERATLISNLISAENEDIKPIIKSKCTYL